MSRSKKTYRSFYLLGLLVLLLLAALCTMLYKAANTQHDREIAQLKLRQQAIVQARAEAVKSWIKDRKREMQAISDNTSVRLYVTEILEYGAAITGTTEGLSLIPATEQQFLQNYLTSVAIRLEMLQTHAINANVPDQLELSGISLFDKNGRGMVYSSPAHALIHQDIFTQYQSDVMQVQSEIYTFAGYWKDQAFIAFVAPLYSVQGDATAEDRLGFVFAAQPIMQTIEPLLQKPDTFEETANTLLVALGTYDNLTFYNQPRTRFVAAAEAKNLGEYQSVRNAGKFVIAPDYEAVNSLAIALPIDALPWFLVHRVSTDETLGPIKKQRRLFLTSGLLGLATLITVLLAVWRHGSSMRFKRLASAFKRQSNLLQLVTDNQPNSMIIVDNQQRYCFANKEAAATSSITPMQMLGKQVRHVMGPRVSEELSTFITRLKKRKTPIMHIHKEQQNGKERVIQSRYIPVKNVPRVYDQLENSTPGVLVVEQDITDAISERERNERILQEMVDAIVGLVDSRDSFMANQSLMTSRLAVSVAQELQLDKEVVNTVHLASKLMNVGKIALPRALLQKKGKLTSKEHQAIVDAMLASAEYIKDIEFNGPVYETVKHIQERVDGTGPLKLKEANIRLEAQIVAACNAYIAMTSDRAYRKGMSHAKASELLMGDIGSHFSRQVIVALINHLDNAGHLPPQPKEKVSKKPNKKPVTQKK